LEAVEQEYSVAVVALVYSSVVAVVGEEPGCRLAAVGV
jgi:hypothetical protein